MQYYQPQGFAYDASGNAWVAISTTTTPPPYAASMAANAIGQINLVTGAVTATTLRTGADSTAKALVSLALRPTAHFLITGMEFFTGGGSSTRFWDVDPAASTGLSCTPPNCWVAAGIAFGAVTINPSTGDIIGFRQGVHTLTRIQLNADNGPSTYGTVTLTQIGLPIDTGYEEISGLTWGPPPATPTSPTCQFYEIAGPTGTSIVCL
jgi:hypothetical protein